MRQPTVCPVNVVLYMPLVRAVATPVLVTRAETATPVPIAQKAVRSLVAATPTAQSYELVNNRIVADDVVHELPTQAAPERMPLTQPTDPSIAPTAYPTPSAISMPAVTALPASPSMSPVTPIPTETIAPTSTHQPTATGTPTVESTPISMATETATPTGEPTTSTAEPTATATVTHTPVATATQPPVATATPIMTATATLACQTQDPTPFDVMLLVDRSSSMRGEKLEDAKQAAHTFVSLVKRPNDRFGLVAFAAYAEVKKELTNDDAAVQAQIDGLEVQDGTDIAGALVMGSRALAEAPPNDQAKPVLILLTDGQSAPDPAMEAAIQAKEQGIRLVIIGLGRDVNSTLLHNMASTGPNGEKDYFYAQDSGALEAIYTLIADTIHPCSIPNELLPLAPTPTPTILSES